jgi:glycerol kinase
MEICGLPLSTYPSAVKLMWMLQNVDAVKKAYEKGTLAFATTDTWLLYHLTGGKDGGVFVTDSTNASRTMLMDLHTLQYSEEVLKFFGLDRSKIHLPEIVPSASATKYGAFTSGELAGVKITGVLGDQHAALVGQKGFTPGSAKNTYGTGCFLVYNVGEEPVISRNGLLGTLAYDFRGVAGLEKATYALEGSIAVAGSAVKFLINNFKLAKESSEVTDLAATVQDNGGCYFVTAFSGLFAPYWIDDAKGTMFGKSLILTIPIPGVSADKNLQESHNTRPSATSPAQPSKPPASKPKPSSTPWRRTLARNSPSSPSTAACPTATSACKHKPTSSRSPSTGPRCARRRV